jgi:hypothetical protein
MKNTIIISSLVLASLFFLTKDKVSKMLVDYETAFKQLKLKLRDISNVDISNSNLSAGVVLNITNPTTFDLGVDSSNMVVLKKLLFYTENGTYFGTATPEISTIAIPANQTIQTPRIPVLVPLNGNLITLGIELMTNSKNIQVQAEIEVLGKTYTV